MDSTQAVCLANTKKRKKDGNGWFKPEEPSNVIYYNLHNFREDMVIYKCKKTRTLP